jgi:hypothetical protein
MRRLNEPVLPGLGTHGNIGSGALHQTGVPRAGIKPGEAVPPHQDQCRWAGEAR